MGTSTSSSSPNIPTWRLFKSILGDPKWPVERQSEELWQAALADRNGRLQDDFSNPILAEVSRLADSQLNMPATTQAFDDILNNNNASGLMLDMAKRALVRATASHSGSAGFASELFAETASYYVSRDLPSFVGARNRINTTGEAIKLKDEFRKIARDSAHTAPIKTDPEGWKSYVTQVLTTLQGKGGSH